MASNPTNGLKYPLRTPAKGTSHLPADERARLRQKRAAGRIHRAQMSAAEDRARALKPPSRGGAA